MMANLRVLVKLGFVLFFLVLFFGFTLPFYPLLKIKPYFTKKCILTPFASLLLRVVFWTMGMRVHRSGFEKFERGALIVGNHTSYLDVVLLLAYAPGCFISTFDTKSIPLFGLFPQLAGSIFIDRFSRNDREREMQEVESHLENGLNIVFFPEAKTTPAEEVIRFRRPFFEPALKMKLPVYCLTINYDKIDGVQNSAEIKTKVIWWNNMPIVKHIVRVLKNKRVDIKVHCEKVKFEEFEKATTEQEVHLADYCHDIVAKRFIPLK